MNPFEDLEEVLRKSEDPYHVTIDHNDMSGMFEVRIFPHGKGPFGGNDKTIIGALKNALEALRW